MLVAEPASTTHLPRAYLHIEPLLQLASARVRANQPARLTRSPFLASDSTSGQVTRPWGGSACQEADLHK